jgi:hypothetical protein
MLQNVALQSLSQLDSLFLPFLGKKLNQTFNLFIDFNFAMNQKPIKPKTAPVVQVYLLTVCLLNHAEEISPHSFGGECNFTNRVTDI